MKKILRTDFKLKHNSQSYSTGMTSTTDSPMEPNNEPKSK